MCQSDDHKGPDIARNPEPVLISKGIKYKHLSFFYH